jgi:hypothetical protein
LPAPFRGLTFTADLKFICVMEKAARPKIVLYQSLGFLIIIALSWFNEAWDLSSLLFGSHPYISNYRESALEMLFILAVWLLVNGATRRVLDHVRRLEGFMKLCAWCHRVEYKGGWIRLEEFLEKGFDTPTSHGICQICLEREKAAADRAKAAARQSLAPGTQAS